MNFFVKKKEFKKKEELGAHPSHKKLSKVSAIVYIY